MTPLALSLGDPAGIGPEIVAGAWRALRSTGPVFVVIGDADAVASTGVPVERVSAPGEARRVFASAVPILDDPLPAPATAGRPDPAAGPAIARWIETAARLALAGEVSAIVTAPIAKANLYASGFAFPGHTEFLGALAPPTDRGHGVGPVMMLAAADLRVSLVTIHEPLARVPSLLSVDRIVNAGLVTAEALRRDFAIDSPRLAVCGLNPHAGESGAIGREEAEIVGPAVETLRARGVEASGPHPSDSLFHPEARGALRRGALPLSRPGADPGEDARLLGRGEHHPWPADRAHLAGPRDRVRHRGKGDRALGQPHRRHPPCRSDRRQSRANTWLTPRRCARR